MASQAWRWYMEYTSPHHGYILAIKEYLYSGLTSFQSVDIVDTHAFGRCLILDGKIQSAQMDEHVYHEALIHPAVARHHRPRRVLIMGGGEGAVLRELCKYSFLEKIVMVDIDAEVVALCKKHLPRWHGNCFEDPRVEVLHLDARRYLAENPHQFDIIYSDLTEPAEEGPSYLLFTKQFYSLVRERLAPGGILVVQAGGISLDFIEIHAAVRNTLRLCFSRVKSYRAHIPSFNSDWGFIMACDGSVPVELPGEEVDRFLRESAVDLRFYDGETHTGMFRLPKDIREALDRDSTVIEDDHPLSIY